MIIKDIIIQEAQKNPHKIFCNIENCPISYKVFNESVESIQKIIQATAHSVKRISLNFNKTIFLLSGIVACNREKKIPIVIPPIEFQLRNFDYKQSSKSEYELNDNSCIVQYKGRIISKSYIYDADETQCVLFSSGTEGYPRSVELTFSNIYYSVDSWNSIVNFASGKMYLNVLPLCHISGLSIFFRSIYCGLSVFYKKYSSKNIIKMLDKVQPDYVSFVPKMIIDIMKVQKGFKLLNKIKLIIIGGDAIDKNIFNYLSKLENNSYASYGMTETASGVAGYFINNQNSFVNKFIFSPPDTII